MSYLWNAISIKCPIYEYLFKWNVLCMKCHIHEMSHPWNVPSMKCPIYEMSLEYPCFILNAYPVFGNVETVIFQKMHMIHKTVKFSMLCHKFFCKFFLLFSSKCPTPLTTFRPLSIQVQLPNNQYQNTGRIS